MHRIALRGPWTLAIAGGQLEGSRRFHAPPGLAVDAALLPPASSIVAPRSVWFLWQVDAAWPVDIIRLNGEAIERMPNRVPESQTRFFRWDAASGIGQVDLSGILKSFNEIVLVWKDWPPHWQTSLGRYSPHPQHLFHLDSWLEIDR
jgi:hypothetical protein